jgi:hypothetical protein
MTMIILKTLVAFTLLTSMNCAHASVLRGWQTRSHRGLDVIATATATSYGGASAVATAVASSSTAERLLLDLS